VEPWSNVSLKLSVTCLPSSVSPETTMMTVGIGPKVADGDVANIEVCRQVRAVGERPWQLAARRYMAGNRAWWNGQPPVEARIHERLDIKLEVR
jgi:hypothetical protein